MTLFLIVGASVSRAQDNATSESDLTSQSTVSEPPTQPSSDAKNNSAAESEPTEEATDNPDDSAAAEGAKKQSILPIKNDAVILGLLIGILALVFWSSSSEWLPFRRFYAIVPMLLMCYFLPSLLTLGHIVDAEDSKLYFVASRYLLPASIVLLTLSVDLKAVFGLGPKALIMFVTGTLGVMIGGPIAMLLVSWFAPDLLGTEGPDELWRGMTTVAGSWIGGGANQIAMKEIFQPSERLFTTMIAVDVLVAEFWMMFLLLGVGSREKIDAWTGADASSVERMKEKMEGFRLEHERVASTTDLFVMLGVAFAATAIAHFLADLLVPHLEIWAEGLFARREESQFMMMASFAATSIASGFFWLIVIATTIGVAISFTPLRRLEGVGASRIGTVFIFILVATIGMQMHIAAVRENASLFLVGLVWMAIHVGSMFAVAYLIKAPYFFLAVGSKANIGGAASAPVVAAAFHPSLAPVGVLLAVLGYVLGTYGAWICGLMMQYVAS